MSFLNNLLGGLSPQAIIEGAGDQANTTFGIDLNPYENATRALENPVSFSTGGLIGGSGGIAYFDGVGGAGVQNTSLQGGLSNPNNRYGVLAVGAYATGGTTLGGEISWGGIWAGIESFLIDLGLLSQVLSSPPPGGSGGSVSGYSSFTTAPSVNTSMQKGGTNSVQDLMPWIIGGIMFIALAIVLVKRK